MGGRRRRNGYRAALAVSAVALGLVLAACGGGDGDEAAATEEAAPATTAAETEAPAETEAAAETATAEPVNVAVLVSGLTDYGQVGVNGIEEAAAAGNATVQVFDSAFDPVKEQQACQDAIASGQYDAILLYPVDTVSAVPCAEEAIAAGLKVVAYESHVGSDPLSTEIQVEGLSGQVVQSPITDARAGADLVVQACEGLDPCNVVYLVGEPAFSYSATKLDQTKKALAEHPNIVIVAEAKTGLGNPDGAAAAVQDVLQTESDVHVIIGDDDTSLGGAVQAVEDAGLTGQIALIGDGANGPAVERIKAGTQFGTVATVPFTDGKVAMEMLLAAIRGEPIADNNVDTQADLSPVGATVTQENVDQFTAEW